MLFVLAFIATVTCQAQGKYQISGKISGMADGTLLLVRNDGAVPDTLAVTALKNGVFMLSGEIDSPAGGYLATADGSLHLPLIVEPTNIMLNVTERGALIQGGEQQKLYACYNQIAQKFAAKQAEVWLASQQSGADMEALQRMIDMAYELSVKETENLIKANPDAYATAYVIALGARNETEEGLRAKYGLLGDAAKSSAAPDFTVSRPNGDALSLYGIPTQNKLLVFWASWDANCRKVNTELIQLYRQFRPKNFEIVSISLDDNRFAWDRAIEQDGISIWSNGSDLKGWDSPVAKLYMVGRTFPYTVLIDGENKIVAKGLWGTDLRKAIADLTKKNKRK